MSPDYSKQRGALISLAVAYEGARDFTRRVLQTAFGDPPPYKCEWPPPAITPTEAHSRLKSVQRFLQQNKDLFRRVLRDIRDAQRALAASGLDAPRSWIITKPLDKISGGYLNACSVTEIVKSAPAEDAALESVQGEIEVDLVLLEGRIAEADHSTPPVATPGTGHSEGEGDNPPAPGGENGTPPGKSKSEGDTAEQANTHLGELMKRIPELDEGQEDWISNKTAASLLGAAVKTLANRRSKSPKRTNGNDSFGVHDDWCFWRKAGKAHPYYYRPLLTEHAGHLAESFPKAKLIDDK